MSSFTSSTPRPAKGSVPAVKRPASSTGQSTSSPFALADEEVLLAVSGRGVHESGAVLERDVLAEHHRGLRAP